MLDAIKELVSRALYPSGAVRTVRRGPLRGVRFVAAPAMRARYALMADGWDETFLASKVGVGDVVFDVGANRGQLTLLFAQEVGSGGEVIAFEPMEENAELLRQNVELNRFQNVRTVNAAAASKQGTLTFEYARASSRQVSKTEESDNLRRVDCVTLDQTAKKYKAWPDVVKIDTEGGAKGVLSGAQRTLDQKPRIFIEVHTSEEGEAVEREILRRGYTARALTDQGLIDEEFTDSVPGGHLWCTP